MGTRRRSKSNLDISSIATEWDSDMTTRQRMRDGGDILHPETGAGEDIPTCVHNKELLAPLLTRMSVSHKKALPGIHDLTDTVISFLKLSK